MGVQSQAANDFTRLIEMTPTLRRHLEAAIAHLIDLLDQYDGSEDTEDDGAAEPSLGWTDMEARFPSYHVCDDRELEDKHDEDGAAAERADDEDPFVE